MKDIKQILNRSMEKKKKGTINLPTESNKNTITEAKIQKDKINLTKQTKNKGTNQKSSSLTNRSAKSNRPKEYDNDLNKLDESQKENDKNYKKENDDSDDDDKEKDDDIIYRTMYRTSVYNKGYAVNGNKNPDIQKDKKNQENEKNA